MFVLECLLTAVLSLIWAIFLTAHSVLINQLGVPVVVAGFWTRLIGVVLLCAAVLLTRELRELIRPGPRVKFALLIGAVAFLVNLCAFAGFRYTSVTAGSVILKTDILFTLIASSFILHERMRMPDWAGTALMLCGTVVLLWRKVAALEAGLVGDLLFLAAAMLLTVNAFIIKTKLAAMSNRVIAVYNSSVTLVGFGVLLVATGQVDQGFAAFSTGPRTLMTIVGGTAIPGLFLLYYRALGRLPFWLVRVLLLFTPIWSVVLECTFLDKRLLGNEVAGGAIILVGAAVIILCHDRKGAGTDSATPVTVTR